MARGLALLALSGGLALAGDGELPSLTPETYAAWRDRIRPTAEELAYRAIPWAPSLAEGLLAAQREGKPVLLWVMDGHPLGGT